LQGFAGHDRVEGQLLGIGHLVGGHEGGAQGREGVAGFSDELLAADVLEIAGRHVVGHAIAGNAVQGFRRRDSGGGSSHHHGELTLVIHLGGGRRQRDLVFGADDGGRRLEEEHGLLGLRRGAQLGRVSGVVPRHAHDLPRSRNRGAEVDVGARNDDAGVGHVGSVVPLECAGGEFEGFVRGLAGAPPGAQEGLHLRRQ
jgi:hypothetical protein